MTTCAEHGCTQEPSFFRTDGRCGYHGKIADGLMSASTSPTAVTRKPPQPEREPMPPLGPRPSPHARQEWLCSHCGHPKRDHMYSGGCWLCSGCPGYEVGHLAWWTGAMSEQAREAMKGAKT
jgi:hypothetical protein